MSRKFSVVIGGIAVIALIEATLALSSSVSAAVANSLRPAGSTRYAMVQSTTEAYDNAVDSGFEDMPGMATSISVPTGKKGDVMVVFCGATSAESAAWIALRAKAGGSVLSPTAVHVDAELDAVFNPRNHCATFYRNNLPEGTRTVKMQWYTGTGASVWDRNMIVTVNIHD